MTGTRAWAALARPRLTTRGRGTNPEAFRAAIAKWCATWRPTATKAVWKKVTEEDHEQRAYRHRYKLDDQRGTTVALSIGMDDGGLTIEDGSM